VAAAFAGWGIPTAEAIREVRAALPNICLIGSGGIRSGVDVAKAIALGADLGATAKPALGPAAEGQGAQGVIDELRGYIEELRIAMLCSGCGDLKALRQLELTRSF
jgi:isopentenyl-diphosphate delta-isomerase